MAKPIETKALLEEIGRYLAAVDLFRAEGCEPAWRPERSVEARHAESAAAMQSPSDVRLH